MSVPALLPGEKLFHLKLEKFSRNLNTFHLQRILLSTARLSDLKTGRSKRGVELWQVPRSGNICLNALSASELSSHSRFLS